jgi:hypothetical protein
MNETAQQLLAVRGVMSNHSPSVEKTLGRPRRTYDSKLALDVQCRLAASQTSLRTLSTTIKVSAATLSRSLAASSFSNDVGKKLRRWLKSTI